MARFGIGVAVALAVPLALTAGCGGSTKKKAAPTPTPTPTPTPASTPSAATTAPAAQSDPGAQSVVDVLKLPAAALPAGFTEDKVEHPTGLDTGTFRFCNRTWAGDADRLARAETRLTQASRKRTVDQEVVFYKGQTAAPSFAEFKAAVDSCKSYKTVVDGKQAAVRVVALGPIAALGPDQVGLGEVATLPDKSLVVAFTIIQRRGPHLLFVTQARAPAASEAAASTASAAAGEAAGYAAAIAAKRPLPPAAEA